MADILPPMQVPPAIPAATIVLVRDGPTGLEVLMVRRHGASGFAAGALVFPGGKIDAVDASLARYCPPADLLPARVAAIRETWEEAGILLARRKDYAESERVLDLKGLFSDPETTLAVLVESKTIELATDALVPFAHWITPEAEPRRFDAQFFIAAAPHDQLAVADGHETLECSWMSPADALREADAGRALVMFPTRLNLMKLARSDSVADALDRAQSEPVVTVQPVIETTPGGRVIRVPPDRGYEITEMRFERS